MKKLSRLVTIPLALAVLVAVRRGLDLGLHHSKIFAFALEAFLWAALLAFLFTFIFKYRRMSAEEKKSLASEEKTRFRFLLGIRRPEETKKRVFQSIGFLFYFITPLLLFLHVLPRYVLLDERLYYSLLYGLVVLFFASFVIPALKEWFNEYPLWMNFMGRFGLGIPAVAGLFSLALVVNCSHDKSIHTRELTCLGKRAATYNGQPMYYVRVRLWSDTGSEVEVDVPKQVFAALHIGANLQVTTGAGTLGAEWIRRIDIARSDSENTQSNSFDRVP